MRPHTERRRPTRRTIGAVAAALAVALVPAVLPLTAAAADPVVVHAADFEDGTTQGWQGRSATASVVDGGHESAKALQASGRTANWNGVQLPVGALLTEGTYEIEAWVRLADPEATPTQMNLGMQQPGAANEYPWVSARLDVDGTTWVHLSGSYTVDDAHPPTNLYVEAVDPTVSFLVDDVTIVGTPPPVPGTVVAHLDFDDESYAPWTQSGSPTLSFVDDDAGGKALDLIVPNDYSGIESPNPIFEPGVEYTLSMRARLGEGSTAGSIRFIANTPGASNEYNWVANTTLTPEWQDITGTFTLPEDADPANNKVYLGIGGTYPVHVVVDDILITAPPGDVSLVFDFEDGEQGWVARDSQGEPTVAVTDTEAHGGAQSLMVSDRAGQGDGAGYDLTSVFETGVTYDITGYVKMAEGEGSDTIWLSARTRSGGTDTFSTVLQVPGVTDTAWTRVEATYTMASAEEVFLYFETSYSSGGPGTFLIDDVTIASQTAPEVEDLPSLYQAYEDMFATGVAIDERETVGAPAELTTRHFNQVTAENHMKPEAWYTAAGEFQVHSQARALMDFAAENDLGLYGHVLVWHSQTPAWFFDGEDGEPLTDSAEDQQFLKDRLRTHIFAIAEALSDEWGPFGSATNPLDAWDVVNEVVSDSGEFEDGLRRSRWYQVLGEDYIDLAFAYADEAFNDVYADPAADRPVKLFINDYNTEQGGKQVRYHALVSRLLEREVPIDGVGHQFHVNLAMPVSALESAIERFEGMGLTQAVTEFDVTTGTPVTTARLIEQGYYYRDAFALFAEKSDELHAVTVWGLTDPRSWRYSAGAPLLFDGSLRAKPAYFGAIGAELEARQRAANVFAGSVALTPIGFDAIEWAQLPLHPVGDLADFQLRWAPDHLTAFVDVTDATASADDEVTFLLGEDTITVSRSGDTAGAAVVREVAGGYQVLAHLPIDAAEGGTALLDVQVVDGATTAGWADGETKGTLTFVEPLSFLEVAETATAPTIDGEIDDVWSGASAVSTDKQIVGTGTAVAEVRTLWQDNTLFVLADVTDPIVDVTGSDPWTQDSVEIYVDAGNYKNGPYRYDDTQIRISADNVASFGTGDEAFQTARLESAVVRTDAGYRVEAAISLLEYGGEGTFHGLDFQVNDATDGERIGIRNWADPTNAGYQSTARWGVGRLVAELSPSFTDVPASHPFATEIAWLAGSGIATGYEDGTFRPSNGISRQAMAAFLYRAVEGGTAPACTEAPFSDVPVGSAFCGEIAWLKDTGATEGYADGTFRPGGTISRQATAAYLTRLGGLEPAACTEAPFSDVPVSSAFCADIAAVAELGIVTGYSDGTFGPGNPVSRQAMAAFLFRAVVLHDLFGE